MFEDKDKRWEYSRLELTPPPQNRRDVPRSRRCLTCGEEFKSVGFRNRMCDGCRRKSRSTRVFRTYGYQRRRRAGGAE